MHDRLPNEGRPIRSKSADISLTSRRSCRARLSAEIATLMAVARSVARWCGDGDGDSAETSVIRQCTIHTPVIYSRAAAILVGDNATRSPHSSPRKHVWSRRWPL